MWVFLYVCRYSNIFVTSPSPENLRTVFDFVLRGFDKLDLVEHEHYDIVQSTQEEFHKAIVRINIFHKHRQTVQVRSLQRSGSARSWSALHDGVGYD